MRKSKVTVLKTSPNSVLDDFQKLIAKADFNSVLDKNKTTILKDNITWHFPFPGANTTPWQLEGTIQALQNAGYNDFTAVHNNTVVTNPYKGGSLNKLAPIYEKYNIKNVSS